VQGRVAILKVHSRGKALGKDVDLEKIARRWGRNREGQKQGGNSTRSRGK